MRISLLIILLAIFTSCGHQAKIDNTLKQYFDQEKVEGSFSLLSNSSGKVTVYNLALDTTRFAPGATFDIVNGLVALEIGTVTSTEMPVGRDSSGNSNLLFKDAFKNGSTTAFAQIAQTVGRDTMQRTLDSLNYGNKMIGTDLGAFWMNDTLKISTDEQLGLVKKLYFGQLKFKKSVQEQMKTLMLQEANTVYKLSYRTASVKEGAGKTTGWCIGWIEEYNHVHFFSTLLRSEDAIRNLSAPSLSVTKNILTHLGFFKGEK